MRPHLPEEELHAYCDEALSPEQRAEAARHLLECLICRAAHADIVALRERTMALLARATPPLRHPVSISTAITPTPSFWRRRGPLVAAAIASVLGTATLVDALRDRGTTASPNDWQQATTIPTIFQLRPAGSGDASPFDVWSTTDRSLAIVATFRPAPATRGAGPAPRVAPLRPRVASIDPIIEPDVGDGWETVDVAAVASMSDHIVRLDGAGLALVGMHRLPAASGARASVLARYQSFEGRTIWVAEGEEEEMERLQDLLERKGLTLSVTRRTRPDYLVTEQGTARAIRHALVAGFLAADSLNALVERLALKN